MFNTTSPIGTTAQGAAAGPSLLEIFGDRPETAARVHRMMASQGGSPVDIIDYLRQVADAFVSPKTELVFDGEQGRPMPQEQALALGFIVGELVTNAVAFAHPTGIGGRVAIVCGEDSDGTLMLTIRDDGVGLPEGFDPARDEQTGLRLVRMLAARLGASMSFESTPLGLSVSCKLPAGA